jgi:aspartyl/asparaginyl beta-hydroxylase (cupin superfamily)
MAIGAGQNMQIADLVRLANQAMQAGRLDDATRLWSQVRTLAPGHPQALLHLGQHQLYRGDPAGARALLEQAAGADPANPVVPLNLSAAFRALGDGGGELAALNRALAIDPYFFPALLAKAMYFERIGRRREAARIYKDVLTIAPPQPEEWAQKPLLHAREIVDQNTAELEAFLDAKLAATRARYDGATLSRFDECKDIMAGAKQVQVQRPTMLAFPRLPAIPFYERRDFPWLAEVEGATAAIREELLVLLREDAAEFGAYVNHPDDVPLNQWAELNRSPKWSAYFLWSNGVRVDAHCARCPRTAAIVDRLPMATVPGAAPAAFFSTLAPRTLIPPHTGVTNTRLIVHIPLIVPEGCWFRVGNEKREWRPGEALIFDDTIEHEAWNGSDQLRAILIFDIWNPYLSEAERALVCELVAGYEDYYAS